MNLFMQMQIKNMITQIDQFEIAMELAAKKDDGEISKEELKTLKKLQKLNQGYKKSLSSLL